MNNKFSSYLFKIKVDVNNYLKLVKASNQQLPTHYSICNQFDEEIDRVARLKEQDKIVAKQQQQLQSNSSSKPSNAQKQLLRAFKVLKHKDKFKSCINNSSLTNVNPLSYTNLSPTQNSSSPKTSCEKKTLETIEKQINQSLKQIEAAKYENTKSSNSLLNNALLMSDETESFIEKEANPSSIYRYKKLKSSLGETSSLKSTAQNNRKVICSTLTLNDAINQCTTIPTSSINGVNSNLVSNSNSQFRPKSSFNGHSRHIMPPVTLQMTKNHQQQSQVLANASTVEIDLNIKTILAAVKPITILSTHPQTTHSQHQLDSETSSAQTGEHLGNNFKTVFFKTNTTGMKSNTSLVLGSNPNISNNNYNTNILMNLPKPNFKNSIKPPLSLNPSYTDLYLINKSQNDFIYNTISQLPGTNKKALIQKTDHRFSYKRIQNNNSNTSFVSNNLSNSFLIESQTSFFGTNPNREMLRKGSSTSSQAGLFNLTSTSKQCLVEDSDFNSPSDLISGSISINGKSYKLPDSFDKSSIKLFKGNDKDVSFLLYFFIAYC